MIGNIALSLFIVMAMLGLTAVGTGASGVADDFDAADSNRADLADVSGGFPA